MAGLGSSFATREGKVPRANYRLAHGLIREAGLMSAPTVIVGGMIAATPLQGDTTWEVLQDLLGLRAGWAAACASYLGFEPRSTGAPRPALVRRSSRDADWRNHEVMVGDV